jgi:hypothetical protein
MDFEKNVEKSLLCHNSRTAENLIENPVSKSMVFKCSYISSQIDIVNGCPNREKTVCNLISLYIANNESI